MTDDSGFTRRTGPVLGGLIGTFRPRRFGDVALDAASGRRGDRIPTDAQLEALIKDGSLVLPPRYFVGYFLDMLI